MSFFLLKKTEREAVENTVQKQENKRPFLNIEERPFCTF